MGFIYYSVLTLPCFHLAIQPIEAIDKLRFVKFCQASDRHNYDINRSTRCLSVVGETMTNNQDTVINSKYGILRVNCN